ncbi:hypothetical protein OSB04_017268 [Centaurea solstitialis]|uniref:Uncharacterized protein n=1 Tax=Centaurea solstitialis TaxID=347529 RepID=A0AA38TMK9_9ASTR|nr:hypothetical protein OSB04_017268 [Centaurea solstitialis]
MSVARMKAVDNMLFSIKKDPGVDFNLDLIWFKKETEVHDNNFLAVKGRWTSNNKTLGFINIYAPNNLVGERSYGGKYQVYWLQIRQPHGCCLEISTKSEIMTNAMVLYLVRACAFNNFISSMDLTEPYLGGSRFTSASADRSKHSKPDRYLLSPEFMANWNNSGAVMLQRLNSHHNPIMLVMDSRDFETVRFKISVSLVSRKQIGLTAWSHGKRRPRLRLRINVPSSKGYDDRVIDTDRDRYTRVRLELKYLICNDKITYTSCKYTRKVKTEKSLNKGTAPLERALQSHMVEDDDEEVFGAGIPYLNTSREITQSIFCLSGYTISYNKLSPRFKQQSCTTILLTRHKGECCRINVPSSKGYDDRVIDTDRDRYTRVRLELKYLIPLLVCELTLKNKLTTASTEVTTAVTSYHCWNIITTVAEDYHCFCSATAEKMKIRKEFCWRRYGIDTSILEII